MKRIIFAMIIILLMAIEARGNTTTITGIITDAQGNPVNGTLILQLPVPAQDTVSNIAITNTPVVYRLVNGVITGNSVLEDVATLQPANLYYITKAYDTSGTPVFAGNYAITGSTYNLGAASPTTVTTSNISYINPATTSGPNTFCNPNPGCSQTFNGQIISIVNTGTPPFIVTSQTLVPNLNVGTWDGITCSGVPTANMVPVAINGTTCTWQPDPGVLSAITNNTSIGTVQGLVSKLTGAPSTATPMGLTDQSGAIGICESGCGNTGTGSFSTVGVANCNFDGGTTAGDYVKISGSVAGDCTDAGSGFPGSGQVLGRVLATNGGGGSNPVLLFSPEINSTSTLPLYQRFQLASPQSVSSGSDVAVSGMNTTLSIPTTGTYRIRVCHSMSWTTGATPEVNFWATDGTTTWDRSILTLATSGSNHAGNSYCESSPNSYTFGGTPTVTVTLMVHAENSITITTTSQYAPTVSDMTVELYQSQ